MSERKISEKIKEIRNSVVAIGFSPALNQITIIGSGFCISDDGKILTTAHIYTQTPPQSQAVLMAMAMVKQEANGLEHYTWLPLTFVKKVDNYDLALFQVNNYKETLLRPSELGNSDKVEVGQDVYFVGFPYAGQLINDGFGITLIVNRAMVSNIKQDGIDLAHARNWFIVDAISNPGNSGCPLFDVETNKVIGIMSIAFRTQSKVQPDLDIREPMHIAGAKPINLAKKLLDKE
ncbi:MAG: hypothetical protein A3A80_01745 [Candidatus Terrybacteria bacterium RIFCSPLOWO2_01_FULL_44_24]|uniref:Serine protease n=1 Tax=Candidatus Terrybacteria bacterium RIFCSPHIGHO2_01_FULL_43_35 TaxID=1802361 RepID=A0A1G2PG17_9BACT|nr:MAG: hypothetical protein A2828_01535 [Candidatus Terrybacteria bacterium RIFCSPHIGHO2_01_FULL_43_35]OHA50808.1 MAG: hypothetical protein A3A80_01745 [Candidatus Terrybacteria bacterium RIFCSPLOWO2_01_FULL_44_24]